MSKIIICFLCLVILLLPLQNVEAHLAGQPPFFKVDEIYSNLYPVPSSSLEDFGLPQDLVAKNYIVGQSINFELDVNQLPVLPETVAKTKFTWDFGDGTHATGLKNTHTYNKMGSYLIVINAQYISDPSAQLLESALINVLPDANYKLPTSIIKINNWTSKDPLTDILNIKFGQNLNFDASSSTPGTGKIVSYMWDLGDQKSSKEAVLTHNYDPSLSQVFPDLRVTDENGFYSDSFAEVENSTMTGSTTDLSAKPTAIPDKSTPTGSPSILKPVLIVVSLILLVVGLFGFFTRSKKKSG